MDDCHHRDDKRMLTSDSDDNDDLTIMDNNDDYVNDWVGLIYDYKDNYDDEIEF